MTDNIERGSEISLTGNTFTIPCESPECQMESDHGHDAQWLVRLSCCNDTEAWCNRRFRRESLRGIFAGSFRSSGPSGYHCLSCGSYGEVTHYLPIRDLGNPLEG